MSPVPPLRREIVVDAAPAVAFDVFTAGIGRWWPLAELSVHRDRSASVAFEDGIIVEHSTSGEEAIWGTVTRWEPPALVAFTWHPGRPADVAGLVEVSFATVDGGTLVTLRHGGWETYADPAATRSEYDRGWPMVLGHYGDEAARASGRA
ncbi:SRPBCC domain-containing protein [Jiangella endophytica]|uniref:SRPBCC domain-containing protein n=1 Tax=Jiangella endophytica TaxID=1623398 RepID=UPI000E346447|nr:SRPBCC domain-containing protein [Jiangella endophytica]